MSVLKRIDELSGNPKVRRSWFALACAFFLIIIVIPSIFVVTKIITEWDLVNNILSDASTMDIIMGAVWNSFSIAFIVTVIDILVGLPLAFPTAVLGLSVSDRIVLMRYGAIAETGSPLEIYRHPKSVFAANFIGETNLLECTVSDKSKMGKTKVRLRGGPEIRVSRTNFNIGDPVVISVRPEHVYSAIDGLRAEVTDVVFMGTYWRVRTIAETRDHIEYNVSTSDEIPGVGDLVHLVFNKKATVVFARPEGGIEEEIRLE